ncbi:MAG: hypothetical protein P1R58_01955 [bacterium]|nr:hypothetical protein [bacterium]
MNARVGIYRRLDAGVGYAVDTEKLLWSARFQPLYDQSAIWRPGLILGTGSVQAGGSDQAAYNPGVQIPELE